MPYQIEAKHANVHAVYRFIGREIFLKVNNNMYKEQMLGQLQAKGGKWEEKKGWLKINMFGDHTAAKLGADEIDLETMTDMRVEDIIYNFFLRTLKSQDFEVTTQTI